jgi:hypothetical protein
MYEVRPPVNTEVEFILQIKHTAQAVMIMHCHFAMCPAMFIAYAIELVVHYECLNSICFCHM